MKIINEYTKGIIEVTVYEAVVPLKRNGYFTPVKGRLETYWIPGGYLTGIRSKENPPMFFPDDGGDPIVISSSMMRWVKKADKYPDGLKGRCDRLQLMDNCCQTGSVVKSKHFDGIDGYIEMWKEWEKCETDEYNEQGNGNVFSSRQPASFADCRGA